MNKLYIKTEKQDEILTRVGFKCKFIFIDFLNIFNKVITIVGFKYGEESTNKNQNIHEVLTVFVFKS